MNQYIIWFSVLYLPIIAKDTLLQHKDLAENWIYPIGNLVDDRMLCNCMTEDFEPIRVILNNFGKDVTVCGAKYQDGSWVEAYPVNQVEFDKYMQGVGDSLPTDSVYAGWFGFDTL